MCSAVPLELTAAERHWLKKMAYGHKTPHQARRRATIVLLAALSERGAVEDVRVQVQDPRCRCHPTLAYLAAYDIQRAEVFGRCEQSTGIVPFMGLVEQVMGNEPYASAKQVFSIVQRRVVSPKRLHRPRRGPKPAPGIRRPLQRHSTAVPVEVHHFRPGRSAGRARPAYCRSPRRILRCHGSVINPRRTFGADHLAGQDVGFLSVSLIRGARTHVRV